MNAKVAKVQRRRKTKARALVRGEPVVRSVLAATLTEVARAGYHGLRIDDVAARAGVNKTTVYRRWPTKQELVRDALLSIATETFSTPDTGSLRTDLLAYARRNAELATKPEHQGVFRIFVAEGDDAELMAIVGSLRQAFESVPREVLAAAQARGEIAPGVDPSLLFAVLGAALNWWLLFERAPVDEVFLQRTIDLLLDGALAPGRRDRPARPAS
ncbi:TetR/AcrR family transcriptional regulator [Nannocystis punicea]|uniref:TetR/AcrR family transcriptional regulator n=1 Tax=Nannocystis punicea TaxID=2995304 RepID=A0ABY7H952_9BACT|nr:TetR/AcrR family transcriptional regulator [Nannocystis poenicansa]WAS95673.1 TetR/AcrR family transcriptional regulator [Nannocystis poenicansa]